MTNGMLYKSNTTGALKHIRTPFGMHRGWQWLQDVAVVSCLSHRHKYSICACGRFPIGTDTVLALCGGGVIIIICIKHQAACTHMYTHACTQNNPAHVLWG